MTQCQFTVPALPPSYNVHFKINYGSRQIYLSNTARAFKNLTKYSMPPTDFKEDSRFKMEMEYHGRWHYKNGKVKRKDIQNLDKILIDAIFERIGCDDSRLWEIKGTKVEDVCENTLVRLETL